MIDTHTIACVLGCATAAGAPYPADAGYMTCKPCAERLWSTLRTIARDYAELAGEPAHLLPAQGEPGPRRPGYGSTAPINLHVVAMLDPRSDADGGPALSAPGTLGSWVRMIAEETAAPSWPDPAYVGGMVDWLSTRWGWITAQPWVDQLAEECRELAAALNRQLRPRPPAVHIGRCAVLVDGQVCGTPLRVNVGDSTIRCRGCGTDWSRARWPELGFRWFDYAMLGQLFATPVGTLRRWRAEDGWTRYGTDGRPLWAHADVLASWQRRHGQTQMEAS